MPSHTKDEREKRIEKRTEQRQSGELKSKPQPTIDASGQSVDLDKRQRETGPVVPLSGTKPREEEERRIAIGEDTGSTEEIARLEQEIAIPQDLRPTPLRDVLDPPFTRLPPADKARILGGNAKPGDITNEDGSVILGTPEFIVADVASRAFAKNFLKESSIFNAALKEVSKFEIFGVRVPFFDINGAEIDTLRASIQKTSSRGEKIEADVKGGRSIASAMSELITMSDDIRSAEDKIKNLSNLNIEYRTSSEYLVDQASILDARDTLIRRIRAVENIGAVGSSVLDPEALLYSAQQT